MEPNEKNINSRVNSSDFVIAMILHKQLKDLLRRNDMTVAQLSRATNISAKTIYQWLNGQKPRDISQVKRLADHFGVSVDFIAFGVQHKSKKEFSDFLEEINAGQFEVILRKVRK